jgi:hypothetical protein
MASDEAVTCRAGHESPIQRVLRLPELLAEVFRHLDRRALSAAVRVNRTWAAAGVRVLWRYPTRKALDALPAKRCAAYDAAIRHIELRVMLKRQPKKAWTLPRLERLTLVYRQLEAERPAMQAALQRHAQRLTHVAIDSVDSRKHGFPQRCARAALAGSELLAHIAACRRLTYLQLDMSIGRDTLLDFVRQVEQPFPCLATLRACVEAAALPVLLGVLPHVAKLCLTVFCVPPSAQGVFACLSSARQVRQLEVAGVFPVSGRDIICLAGLCELEALRIAVRCLQFASDQELASVLSGLRHLRELQLPWARGLSRTAYILAGKLCRRLTHLELRALCDLGYSSGHHSGPLFPFLETLSMRAFQWS